MSQSVWRRVPAGGEAYIRERLDHTGLSLARAIAPELASFQAGVCAVVPEDAPDEAIAYLQEGLSASAEVEYSLVEPVIDWLERLLTASSSMAVIFGSAGARIDEPRLARSQYGAALGAEAYTVVTGAQATSEALEHEFRWSLSYTDMAFVLRDVSESDLFAAPRLLQPNLAQNLAGRVIAVIVEAYDAEGVLVWVRDAAPGQAT